MKANTCTRLTGEGSEMHALTFSPNRYWLCAASGPRDQDLGLKGKVIVDECRPDLTSLGVGKGPGELSKFGGVVGERTDSFCWLFR